MNILDYMFGIWHLAVFVIGDLHLKTALLARLFSLLQLLGR